MRKLYILMFTMICFFHYDKLYHMPQWSLLFLVIILGFSYKLAQKYHISLGLLYFWVVISGSYLFIYRWNGKTGLKYIPLALQMYSQKAINLGDALPVLTLVSVLTCIIIITMVEFTDFAVKRFKFNNLLNLCALISTINAILIIIHYFMGYNLRNMSGLFGNSAPNGMFIATCFPFIFSMKIGKKEKITLATINIIAIILLQASIPIGVLIVAMFSMILLSKLPKKHKITMVFIPIVIFLTAYLYDSRLLNDSNRIDFYKIVINDFINNRNIYFGTGTGTFNVYSIGMQIVNNFMIKQWFMWCHSDWLQILYENGIIGILLALYVLVSALIKSRKNLALVSAISAYASAMIFSYPLHYAHTALLACFLILLAFSEKTDKI
jgi:hypothetical protein